MKFINYNGIIHLTDENVKQKEKTLGLCKFSGLYGQTMPIVIDSQFITEFLPYADADAIKVYFFGLNLCFSKEEQNNNIEYMASVLSMSEERIISGFEHWHNLGLVQVIAKDPLEIRYLPVDSGSGRLKKYKTDKYHDFNVMLQSIISGREILPNEFNEYYYFIESSHIEPEAFLSIAKYCTMLKSDKVRYPYILAVAKSFAQDGLLTQQTIEEKLIELEQSASDLKAVLRALGIKRDGDPEERKMYVKWTKSLGFSQSVILYVARQLKGQSIYKLDESLMKYYQNKLFSISEIENYSETQEKMLLLAKDITRSIGVFYQNLDKVIETYVADWLQKGYERDTLMLIADYCFKKSIRTLEGMNSILQKFYKLGLITIEAIEQYTSGLASVDNKISNILEKVGLIRNVNSWDRDFYRTWTFSWNIPESIIMLVAEKSKGKEQPLAYMNKILSNLHSKGINDEKEAERYLEKEINSKAGSENMMKHMYSEKDLSALFDNLDDIEV